MKTRVDVATARPFTSLLISSGRRFAIAMSSVWHRPRQSKMAGVNCFRSDYPLYFARIAWWSLDTVERHYAVCVSVVDAKCVACFWVDSVRVFLHPHRVTNDGRSSFGIPRARRIRSGGPPILAKVARHSCVSSKFLVTTVRAGRRLSLSELASRIRSLAL
jgi:hypothetical protein